jgi:3-phosphoshikimate 1-carboxyvinyltransferase
MHKNALVSFKSAQHIEAEIQLTGSKSECNRALIIQSLSKGDVKVENISNAADTVTLNHILQQLAKSSETTDEQIVDVGPAGTAMRFLTAFLNTQSGNFLLTGTERMKQRPIGILAEALKSIGANISYSEQDGYPPLKITGPFTQTSSNLKIKGNISSQYISALLMLAPSLPLGLNLHIEDELTSRPYVEMTLAMLNECGISHQWDDNVIRIAKQDFQPSTLIVEPDWSAASYWYSIVALAKDAKISLPYLREKSLQGDSQIKTIMEIFGLSTHKTSNGIAFEKTNKIAENPGILDLKTCPDLAQTIIVVAAALGQNLAFTGLETLKIKETDRVAALQIELAKIGVKLLENNLVYTLDCSNLKFPKKLKVATYEDHRMAMAFAPLALLIDELEIEDYRVVEKSYPYFWEDLKKIGFSVAEIV